MQIAIKNFRGAEDAALTLAPIALVCGHNYAGKTSIAQAVAAALTRNAAPLDGLAKKDARQLLRDGASRGNCRVGDDSGYAQANWPGGSVTDEGHAPAASDIACGLESLVDMKPSDRAGLLIRIMDALPTREQLGAAVDVPAQVVDAVWKMIEAEGWDAAYKRARAKGAELKGAWEHITGEKWGAVKGESWWPAVLDKDVPEDPQADLDAARAHLEECIRNRAGDEARRKALTERAEAERESPDRYIAERDWLAERIAQATDDLAALPHATAGDTPDCACPHCGGDLVIQGRTARAPGEAPDPKEQAARSAARQKKQAEIEDLKTRKAEQDRIIGDLAIADRDIERAVQELQAMPAGSVTAEQEQAARDAVAHAEAVVRAARDYVQANEKHKAIVQNQALAGALAPDGLRQTVLAEKMAEFNRTLAAISGHASWPEVQVRDDLAVTYGGRAYALLSASEQFRARVTLQLAMAGMDGSDAVVIDAADILDRGGRNGLFSAVAATQMRALICMTMDDEKNVPPLSKAGLGRSYWMGGGKLAPAGA